MKRDDIIQQKLFEAYKLSEFYLNLIVDDNYNPNNYKKGIQEETPFQLSKAFSNKLYQIVTRYDTLLEQNDFEQKATLISTPTNNKKKFSFSNSSFDNNNNNISSNSNTSQNSDDSDTDTSYEFNNYVNSLKRRNSIMKTKKTEKQQKQQKQNITKSLSNLSKDSGIILDISHNSDTYSFANSNDALSNITNSFISEQLSENDVEDNYCEDSLFSNSNSNSNSNNNNNNENNLINDNKHIVPIIELNKNFDRLSISSISTINIQNEQEEEDISINSSCNNLYQLPNSSTFNWHLSPTTSKLLGEDNDSLMNVSMIDNIEAVYKTSDKNDSMNSSILTFI